MWKSISSVIFTVFFMSGIAHASTSTVRVKVTLIKQPQCIINDNNIIDVDFGEVIASRIDGEYYLTKVNYTLECKENISNSLKMQFLGIATNFDRTALQTNINDLGIGLRANNIPVNINEWISFEYPNLPDIQVIPLKNSNAVLTGGDFHAAATLLVDYQ